MAQYINMKQVPSGTVTAKDDRIVYDSNLADSGIIYGCEISYTGNNMIHINAGYGIIKGGLFEIEDHTEYVDLAEDANTTGQIYLHLDLSADDKLIIVSETTNSLHPMEQNVNANFEDGVYEFQLCTYVATTTALEDVVQTFSVVQSGVIDSLQEIAANTTGGLKAGALAVKELNSNLLANGQPFKYGYDSESDKYGYIRKVDGADTFFPFSSGGLTDDAQIVLFISNDPNPASGTYTPTEDCTLLFCAMAGVTNNGSTVHYWSVTGGEIEKQLQQGVGTTNMRAIVQLKATANVPITFRVTSNSYTAYQFHRGMVIKL